jgi:hypothetical protein
MHPGVTTSHFWLWADRLHKHHSDLLEKIMSLTHRIILAIGICLVDIFLVFMPLTAFFLAYVLIFNPSWFRDFINNLEPA